MDESVAPQRFNMHRRIAHCPDFILLASDWMILTTSLPSAAGVKADFGY